MTLRTLGQRLQHTHQLIHLGTLQLVQWLRLAALWAPSSAIFPAHVTNWSRNGALCRVYLCVSMGLLEPLVLLCALLLCRGGLR